MTLSYLTLKSLKVPQEKSNKSCNLSIVSSCTDDKTVSDFIEETESSLIQGALGTERGSQQSLDISEVESRGSDESLNLDRRRSTLNISDSITASLSIPHNGCFSTRDTTYITSSGLYVSEILPKEKKRKKIPKSKFL